MEVAAIKADPIRGPLPTPVQLTVTPIKDRVKWAAIVIATAVAIMIMLGFVGVAFVYDATVNGGGIFG